MPNKQSDWNAFRSIAAKRFLDHRIQGAPPSSWNHSRIYYSSLASVTGAIVIKGNCSPTVKIKDKNLVLDFSKHSDESFGRLMSLSGISRPPLHKEWFDVRMIEHIFGALRYWCSCLTKLHRNTRYLALQLIVVCKDLFLRNFVHAYDTVEKMHLRCKSTREFVPYRFPKEPIPKKRIPKGLRIGKGLRKGYPA